MSESVENAAGNRNSSDSIEGGQFSQAAPHKKVTAVVVGAGKMVKQ